jgi:hypothetical protein
MLAVWNATRLDASSSGNPTSAASHLTEAKRFYFQAVADLLPYWPPLCCLKAADAAAAGQRQCVIAEADELAVQALYACALALQL